MDLRGTIQDGKLILDSGLSIPDGTRVKLQIGRTGKSKKVNPLTRIAKRAVHSGIPNLADRHDEYVLGVPAKPKRKQRGAR